MPELLTKLDDDNGDAITRFAMKLMAYTFVRTSERDRVVVTRSRYLRIDGTLQNQDGVVHVKARNSFRSTLPAPSPRLMTSIEYRDCFAE